MSLVLLAGVPLPASAALLLNSYAQYRTGDDQFHPEGEQAFGTRGEAFGTDAVSLAYTGGGPLGGQFSFTGSASSAALALRAAAALSLSDYRLGSYYMIDGQPYDYLPQSGFAQALSIDQTIINGPDATYSLQFSYRLTGTAQRAPDQFDSFFRPGVGTGLALRTLGTDTLVGSEGVFFYPGASDDRLLVWTIAGVPSNTALSLTQYLRLILYSADTMYLGSEPCDSGIMLPPGTDPSPRPCMTGLIGADPYSVGLSADFGHTLQLQHVAVLGAGGGVAPGAALVSLNGVRYPGQADVPAPATISLLVAGLAAVAGRRRWRR
ncbi:hypothetical protein TBR22_A41890 [Luteitalea sp. TBR-22]|uniref:PEP-CTERM sorting domain-containing protein n=1 Tax=Luteitalea sp. TBR-22 TaxID=2802971 RepID=UPI001AF83EEF|nr:PEP-CTERM sorting domain-containing protein [Luteitalea sp. TBR-22]BCS34963.1 hypothetical protein TBR22_A41890 [Luteitalea sp. TBR-22]